MLKQGILLLINYVCFYVCTKLRYYGVFSSKDMRNNQSIRVRAVDSRVYGAARSQALSFLTLA
jgi:hypothetical protein